MPEAILGPIFSLIEGSVGAILPGALGGAVVTGLEGAVEGAGLGAISSAVQGKDILKGAEFGGLTGGLISGAGPFVGEATGLGATAADTLTGAGAGALAGKLTGEGAGAGALQGGIGGLLEGIRTPKPAQAPTTSAGVAGGGAPGGAVASAAPASVAPGNPDITSRFANDFASSPTGSLGSADLNASPSGVVGSGSARFEQDFFPASATAGTVPAGGADLGVRAADGAASGAASLVPPSVSPITGSAPVAAAAAAPASGGNVLSNLLTKNPNELLSGVGLAGSILKGDQKPAGYDKLLGLAKQESAQGTQLEGYLASGTLPPGIAASLKAAHDDAAAAVRSQYASRGMSGSSAEAQDLQRLSEAVVTQGAGIASNLLQQGISETQLSSQLYSALMQAAIQQDNDLSQSIGTFSASLAQAGRPVTPTAAAA